MAAPSATVDGMWGDNFTGRRMNIHGGVDGLKAGSNTTLECSYIHDQAYFAVDPNQGGGPTHNDAIQILDGTGIHIVGNQLVAAMDQNAAIQVTQDFGAVGDLHIETNWADGGGCTFNIAHKVEPSLTDVHVIGNRFGRNSYFNCPILKSTQTTLELGRQRLGRRRHARPGPDARLTLRPVTSGLAGAAPSLAALIALSRNATGTAITAGASRGAKLFATRRQFRSPPSQG